MKPNVSGRYRQQILLYDVPESTTDTWGQPSQTPTLIPNTNSVNNSFHAEVIPLQGAEQLNVRAVWPTATHKVTMRWLGSMIPVTTDNPQGLIMPQMVLKLLLDNSYLHVLFADNVEKRNRMWILTCEEKIGATS